MAVAQNSFLLSEVVMPGGQEVWGMQKVSSSEFPSSMVTLYHWSEGQEHETARTLVSEPVIVVGRRMVLTADNRRGPICQRPIKQSPRRKRNSTIRTLSRHPRRVQWEAGCFFHAVIWVPDRGEEARFASNWGSGLVTV